MFLMIHQPQVSTMSAPLFPLSPFCLSAITGLCRFAGERATVVAKNRPEGDRRERVRIVEDTVPLAGQRAVAAHASIRRASSTSSTGTPSRKIGRVHV